MPLPKCIDKQKIVCKIKQIHEFHTLRGTKLDHERNSARKVYCFQVITAYTSPEVALCIYTGITSQKVFDFCVFSFILMTTHVEYHSSRHQKFELTHMEFFIKEVKKNNLSPLK